MSSPSRRRAACYAHPRTESHLYEEAKRLLRLGWATSHTEHHGRRPRTIYEITGDGRSALQAWFAPPRDPDLNFEALLQVLFADQTDKATLDRSLEETAEKHAGSSTMRSNITQPVPERRWWSVP